jgi:hypothetical protein
MNKRAGESPEERDRKNAVMRLHFDAAQASVSLVESWKRPERHNRTIEREALFNALLLDEDCRITLSEGNYMPPAEVASAETRYEVRAAILTVHTTLPFSISERDRLTPPTRDAMMRNYGFYDEAAVEQPLLERWHDWLWMDERGVPQNSVEALGASAVLGVACQRLTASVREVMHNMGL